MQEAAKKQNERPAIYPMLKATDIITRVSHLVGPGGGWHVSTTTGKIEPLALSMDPDKPWIYFFPPEGIDRYCKYWMSVVWGCFGQHPIYCREVCHKIVVRPRTIVELVRLHDLMADLGLDCKCGTEERMIVPALYGGYFYFKSMEEALGKLPEIRKLLGKHVGHKITANVKIGCTEMELRSGPSDKWPPIGQEERDLEEVLLQVFDPPMSSWNQPQFVKNHVMLGWMESAWRAGDMTVMEFNAGRPLIRPAVTYEP